MDLLDLVTVLDLAMRHSNITNLRDLKGSKNLMINSKDLYNYKPDLIVAGHADLLSKDQIQELKEENLTLSLPNGSLIL